jgi:hypothetical protein
VAVCLGTVLIIIFNDMFSIRRVILPTIEANYKQIYDKISGTTNDVRLASPTDSDSSLYHVGKSYTGCIRGGFLRTYGANRSFKDVLADYRNAFPEMLWQENEDFGGVASKTTRIQLHRINSTSPDYAIGEGKYLTLYTVSLVYADPAVASCYG